MRSEIEYFVGSGSCALISGTGRERIAQGTNHRRAAAEGAHDLRSGFALLLLERLRGALGLVSSRALLRRCALLGLLLREGKRGKTGGEGRGRIYSSRQGAPVAAGHVSANSPSQRVELCHP